MAEGTPHLQLPLPRHTRQQRRLDARTCGLAALSKVPGPREARATPRPGSPMLLRRLNPLVERGSSVPRRLLNAMAAAAVACLFWVVGTRVCR